MHTEICSVFRSCFVLVVMSLCFYFSVVSSVFLSCFSLAVTVYSVFSIRVLYLFFYSILPFCSIFPSFTISIAVCSVVFCPSFSAFVLSLFLISIVRFLVFFFSCFCFPISIRPLSVSYHVSP